MEKPESGGVEVALCPFSTSFDLIGGSIPRPFTGPVTWLQSTHSTTPNTPYPTTATVPAASA